MDFQHELANLTRVSPAIRDALRRHPEWGDWLKERLRGPEFPEPQPQTFAELRDFRQRKIIEIAFRDISGLDSFEETVVHLSRLADQVIAAALNEAWRETWVASVRRDAPFAAAFPENADTDATVHTGFAVIAMGKHGGGELNYSSDVDLVFCRRTSDDDGERDFFTRVGERLVHLLGQPGPEGALYRVDMRLRPHGETGPLVPTIDSLENYYESWGEAWERQALIKARPICGDPAMGGRLERFAGKFVFARQMDDTSLEDIKQVKHRSEREYARAGDRIHIKQGPGGIRDIEFYVQYLQLIAGSKHPQVRARATLDALSALGSVKSLLEGEESQLALAYVFLRTVEHRLQLRFLTPEALIPDKRQELDLLAGGLGFSSTDEFSKTLRRYRSNVRSILERIYLIPGHLRPAEREQELAQLLSERTPKQRVRELLSAYGFKDIEKAWQNVRLMALGPAGRLLPPGERRAFLEIVFPLLEVLRDSYDPDQALHNLESFAAASGNRVSFLRTLASRRPHLKRLANLLGLSNVGHQILSRHPEYFDSLARGINLHEGRSYADMLRELQGRLQNAPAGQRPNALRRYRQREMIRIAYRDLAGLAGPIEISEELSALAEACLQAAIQEGHGEDTHDAAPLWVIALGKLGSRQMHYSSDLDLLFLYQDPPADSLPEFRTRLQLAQDARVERLLELLAGITSEGTAYKIDLRLRPEGASGLLARSWSSFLDHAHRYMQPWERMALVRSRILTESKEVKARWEATLSEVIYEFCWDEHAVTAIRHLKRRIESEKNKESRIYLDFKFGCGGISDIEFLIQLLQVLNGKKHPAVRAHRVADAIAELRNAGVVSALESQDLFMAHKFERHVENHYQLVEEWTSREISRESPVLDRVARSLGFWGHKEFVAEWERIARQVRELVNKYFY